MEHIDIKIYPKNIQIKNKRAWKNSNKICLKKTNKKRKNT